MTKVRKVIFVRTKINAFCLDNILEKKTRVNNGTKQFFLTNSRTDLIKISELRDDTPKR